MSVAGRLPFKNAIKILETFGFWINKNSSFYYCLYGLTFHVVFIELCMVMQIVEIPNLETVQDVASLTSFFPTYVGLVFKSLNLIVKSSEVENLFELTEKLLDECPKKEIVLKRLKVVNKFFKAGLSAAMAACAGATVLTIFKLPYKMWFPFDVENNRFGYWISAIYESGGTTCLALVTISLDMIPIFFMCYSIVFLEVLCDRLISIKKTELPKRKNKPKNGGEEKEDKDEVDNYKELLKCIEFQLKIDEYFRQISAIFARVFFVQGLVSIPILCTSTVSLTLVSFQLSFKVSSS